ncbi:MAG: hypothetical protein CMH77_07760 [Nitrospinae bacterium]|jgi:septal ring factor EnvC (AmiA/AmiB activator)|nr:hypothetical protein [Nitrospinota bacterium]MDP6336027.1 peptidoglycan DD-metalloendopeptidase family protein [Nitrospinaceae bacterium]
MNSLPIKTIQLILILVGFIAIIPVSAGDKKIDEINDLLKKEKVERDKLQSRIKKQSRALFKMGKKEHSSLKKQRILDDRLKMRRRELKIYDWNIKLNQKKYRTLTKSLATSRNQLSLQRKEMGRRLRTIYKEGSLFPVKILFSSDNFNDLLKRLKYMESVAAYDSVLFNDYNSKYRKQDREKEALLHAKGKLLLFKESAENKKKEISAENKEKKRFLARLKKEKKLNKQLKNELIQSSNKLNRLIARLEEKLILGEGLDISDKKGRLSPPVKGKFLNKFGRKRDKHYDTYIVYNGLNIRSAKGTPVRSVFAGKVLYTGTLEGYGNIIIIGHGKEFHSLYGHLDEINTLVGKTVRSGQIIGRSGDTGSILGESLYFEIRHKGKPIEPTAWLSRSKK